MLAMIWHSPLFQATIAGVLAGAAVDIHAWIQSPTWRVDGFNIAVASKRWVTGGVVAFLAKAGFGALGA